MHKQHQLSPAAVSMLAIGGTIGTGLFFSVSALLTKGPLTTLLSMAYVALIVVSVLQSAGDLAAAYPETGLICKFQYIFIGRAAGLANSLVYWISWGLTFALELSLVVSIVKFWAPEFGERYQTAIILTVFICLTAFNLLPVDIYGQIEYWMALIKVVAIVGWIFVALASLIMQKRVFSTWTYDWPRSFTGDFSSKSHFSIDFVNSLIFLSFLFQSVESVAISSRDLENPQKHMRYVLRIVFFRIVIFYIASVALLSLTIPFEDKKLHDPQLRNLMSSPFLIALQNLGFKNNRQLLSAFNFVILSAILSAANSNIYFGSRYLQTLAETEVRLKYWEYFAQTNRHNTPVRAVLATAAFGAPALLLRFRSINIIFNFLLTCCALAGMLMWCLLSLLYVRYTFVLQSQGLSWRYYRRIGAIWAMASMTAILASAGLQCYYDFSYAQLIASYMTAVVFFGLYFWFGGGYIPLKDIQLPDLKQYREEEEGEHQRLLSL